MSLKATVVLEGQGGELDRAEVVIKRPGEDPEEELSLAIHSAIENWVLSPGDVIRIEGKPV
jgi:hypothetical protein